MGGHKMTERDISTKGEKSCMKLHEMKTDERHGKEALKKNFFKKKEIQRNNPKFLRVQHNRKKARTFQANYHTAAISLLLTPGSSKRKELSLH